MNPSRFGRPLSLQSSSCFPEKALDQSPGRGSAAVFCVAKKSAPLQWAWALGLVMACLTGGFATSRLQAQTASFSDAIATLGGGFSNPSGMAVDGSGNVYVADCGQQCGEGDARRLRLVQLRDNAGRRLQPSLRRGGGRQRQRLCRRHRQQRGEGDARRLRLVELRDHAGQRLQHTPTAWRWTAAATSTSPIAATTR